MLIRLASVIAVIGLILVAIFAATDSYIDTQGILREPFWMLPTGLALMLLGVLLFIAGRIKKVTLRRRT